MDIHRRDFLKMAGASTVVALLGGWAAVELLAPGEAEQQHAPGPGALTAQRWAMAVDLDKLDGAAIQRCREVCHRIHNVPDIGDSKHEIKWIWPEPFKNAFPEASHAHIPDYLKARNVIVLCNHCDNPPCVRVCPTKATWKRGDGVVMMDQHRCIGCRYCMAACPYGARSFNWRDPRPFIKNRNPEYPTRSRGVVEKCNFCAERLAVGLAPGCVDASNGALVFGDVTEPFSGVRRMLRTHYTIRRKAHLGTEPSIYYLVKV